MEKNQTSSAQRTFKKAHQLCRSYGRAGLTTISHELWKVMDEVLFKRPNDPLAMRTQQAHSRQSQVTRVEHPSVLFPLSLG